MTKPIPATLTRMVGIDYPVIGAPMWQVSYEDPAAAVSNAGGPGCIALPITPHGSAAHGAHKPSASHKPAFWGEDVTKTEWSRRWSAGPSVVQASAIKPAKTVVEEMAARCGQALAAIGGVPAS